MYMIMAAHCGLVIALLVLGFSLIWLRSMKKENAVPERRRKIHAHSRDKSKAKYKYKYKHNRKHKHTKRSDSGTVHRQSNVAARTPFLYSPPTPAPLFTFMPSTSPMSIGSPLLPSSPPPIPRRPAPDSPNHFGFTGSAHSDSRVPAHTSTPHGQPPVSGHHIPPTSATMNNPMYPNVSGIPPVFPFGGQFGQPPPTFKVQNETFVVPQPFPTSHAGPSFPVNPTSYRVPNPGAYAQTAPPTGIPHVFPGGGQYGQPPPTFKVQNETFVVPQPFPTSHAGPSFPVNPANYRVPNPGVYAQTAAPPTGIPQVFPGGGQYGQPPATFKVQNETFYFPLPLNIPGARFTFPSEGAVIQPLSPARVVSEDVESDTHSPHAMDTAGLNNKGNVNDEARTKASTEIKAEIHHTGSITSLSSVAAGTKVTSLQEQPNNNNPGYESTGSSASSEVSVEVQADRVEVEIHRTRPEHHVAHELPFDHDEPSPAMDKATVVITGEAPGHENVLRLPVLGDSTSADAPVLNPTGESTAPSTLASAPPTSPSEVPPAPNSGGEVEPWPICNRRFTNTETFDYEDPSPTWVKATEASTHEASDYGYNDLPRLPVLRDLISSDFTFPKSTRESAAAPTMAAVAPTAPPSPSIADEASLKEKIEWPNSDRRFAHEEPFDYEDPLPTWVKASEALIPEASDYGYKELPRLSIRRGSFSSHFPFIKLKKESAAVPTKTSAPPTAPPSPGIEDEVEANNLKEEIESLKLHRRLAHEEPFDLDNSLPVWSKATEKMTLEASDYGYDDLPRLPDLGDSLFSELPTFEKTRESVAAYRRPRRSSSASGGITKAMVGATTTQI